MFFFLMERKQKTKLMFKKKLNTDKEDNKTSWKKVKCIPTKRKMET